MSSVIKQLKVENHLTSDCFNLPSFGFHHEKKFVCTRATHAISAASVLHCSVVLFYNMTPHTGVAFLVLCTIIILVCVLSGVWCRVVLRHDTTHRCRLSCSMYYYYLVCSVVLFYDMTPHTGVAFLVLCTIIIMVCVLCGVWCRVVLQPDTIHRWCLSCSMYYYYLGVWCRVVL